MLRILLTIAMAATQPDAIFKDGFQFNSAACPIIIDPGDGLFRTLLLRGNITYGVYQAQRPNVDLTEFDNVWGHNSATDSGTPWPGVGGAAPVIRNASTLSYVSARFEVPLGTRSSANGFFSHPSYIAPPAGPGGERQRLTMAISQQCGDFTDYLPTPGCLVENVPASDAVLTRWKLTANAPGSQCNLWPGGAYYVNMMFTDPTICARPQCLMGTVSYHD